MRTKGIVGCGKNHLAYNDVEDIEFPIAFVLIIFTLERIPKFITQIMENKAHFCLLICPCKIL